MTSVKGYIHNALWQYATYYFIFVNYQISASADFLRLNHMNTWQEKFTNITWDTLREGTFELSKQIETNTLKPDLIVAIAVEAHYRTTSLR